MGTMNQTGVGVGFCFTLTVPSFTSDSGDESKVVVRISNKKLLRALVQDF